MSVEEAVASRWTGRVLLLLILAGRLAARK